MSLIQAFKHHYGEVNKMVDHSYYGRMDATIFVRSLADDLIKENEGRMIHEMKEMEDRIKRHITECKREVIKEIENIFSDAKPKSTKKEVKYVRNKRNVNANGRNGGEDRISTANDRKV